MFLDTAGAGGSGWGGPLSAFFLGAQLIFGLDVAAVGVSVVLLHAIRSIAIEFCCRHFVLGYPLVTVTVAFNILLARYILYIYTCDGDLRPYRPASVAGG